MPTPRAVNLYLVFGYQVSVADRNIILCQKGEEAMDLGISITMTPDGQKCFAGRHVGTLEAKYEQDHKVVEPPHIQENDDLPWKLEKLGIKVEGKPKLIMVAS